MFITTRDPVPTGPRRAARPDGINRTARSSKLSILSVVTSSSSGSGGSTSTITPDTYSRTRRDPLKRVRKKRKSREGLPSASQSAAISTVNAITNIMKSRSNSKESPVTAKAGERSRRSRHEERAAETVDPKKSVDVFEFLVEDGKRSRTGVKSEKRKGKAGDRPTQTEGSTDAATETEKGAGLELGSESEMKTVTAHESDLSDSSDQSDHSESDQSDPECYYRSHLSDSGISMGSSTGESSTIETPLRTTLPPLIEEPVERMHAYSPSVVESVHYQNESHGSWGQLHGIGLEQMPSSPMSVRSFPMTPDFHHDLIPSAPPSVHSYHNPGEDQAPPQPPTESPSCLSSAPLIFRDRNGAIESKPQLHRNFANLNARMLLQMQANIADLEQQLTTLDAKTVSAETSKSRKGESGRPSRRFSRDQSRRADIYQELHVSLDQYYQALSATHQMSQINSSPKTVTPQELNKFRKWLYTHVSPSSKIQPLTGDGTDLVSFKSTVAPNTPSNQQNSESSAATIRGPFASLFSSSFSNKTILTPSSLRVVALAAFLNTMLPLLIYKLMTSTLDRLVFWTFAVAVDAIATERLTTELHPTQQNCMIAFAGISLCAALFL